MTPHRIYGIENIEEEALAQFRSALEQPYVVQAALMPDAHAGYSLPIGAVVATEGYVVPAWVGYDIGCGMCAIPTSFRIEVVRKYAKEIFNAIYGAVPTGFAHNRYDESWSYPGRVSDFVREEILTKNSPQKQIGTLGGGNHFIEIGYDENDRVWIIIHSGSRNVGHKIATHYMKIAAGDGKAREGHYALPIDSVEGQNYIDDLAFGLQFALDNRKTMIARICMAIQGLGISGGIEWENLINRNHNHAEERVLKQGDRSRLVWVHRKGATHAEEGMLGVIPGNMRDGSFIVRGKGNPDSLFSSSHGAGRVLGRKAAKESLSMDDFKATMTEAGVVAKVEPGTLDESPSAYKSIFDVMAMQTELVDVIHHVKPLINVKGLSKEC